MEKKSDWLHKLLALLALVAFVIIWSHSCPAKAEEKEDISTGTYSAITEDFELDDILDVRIEQSKIKTEKTSWSMREIDWYLKSYRAKIKEYQEAIDGLEKIRVKVEEEAKKVKLRTSDMEGS